MEESSISPRGNSGRRRCKYDGGGRWCYPSSGETIILALEAIFLGKEGGRIHQIEYVIFNAAIDPSKSLQAGEEKQAPSTQTSRAQAIRFCYAQGRSGCSLWSRRRPFSLNQASAL